MSNAYGMRKGGDAERMPNDLIDRPVYMRPGKVVAYPLEKTG